MNTYLCQDADGNEIVVGSQQLKKLRRKVQDMAADRASVLHSKLRTSLDSLHAVLVRMVKDAAPKQPSAKELIRKIHEIDRAWWRGRGEAPDGQSEIIYDPTASMAANLRKVNAAYATFEENQKAADDFSQQAREAGRKMAERFQPVSRRMNDSDCRRPISKPGDNEESWADAMNRAGARMRNQGR